MTGSMDWWYWFGLWVFGATSLAVTWWIGVDSWRHEGTFSRFTWLGASLVGLVLQVPAIGVVGQARSGMLGTAAAVLGLLGVLVVAISAITHFAVSGPASRTTFGLRTRDSASHSLTPRARSRSLRASVQLGPAAQRVVAAQAAVDATSSAPQSDSSQPVKAPPSTPATRQPTPSISADVPSSEDSDPTLLAEEPPPGAADRPEAERTVEDDATLSASGEPDARGGSLHTISDHLVEGTVVDEEARPTILDEAEAEGMPHASDDGVQARLDVTGGRSTRLVISDRGGPFVVGRDPDKCSLAVDDERASRRHFAIHKMASSFMIEDLSSTNGTFVNGAPVRENVELSNGDTIEFGRTIATFVGEGDS